MPELLELQRAFIAALLAADGDAARDVASFDAGGIDVHRNNVRVNLANALRSAYPVVERLVGSEFFAYAAQCFIETHPSRSANLEDYGAGFGEFLRDFAPAESLPYLADVAALEAAIERVARAADDAASARLDSPYPILRIWQVNQPGWCGDDSVSLDTGADRLHIHRVHGDVLIESLDAGAPAKI
jgi:hypothetical protein